MFARKIAFYILFQISHSVSAIVCKLKGGHRSSRYGIDHHDFAYHIYDHVCCLAIFNQKHIFDIGVADCMKIKDPARFEAPQGWFYIHISANICPFSYDLYTYFIN